MKKIYLLLGALTALTACTPKQQQTASTPEPEKIHSLVLYYSQDGATRQIAELLAEKTGADIDSIVAENPYNGNFDETIARCQQEMKDSILTPLKALDCNVADYDTIYVGYPIWFGTYARPITSLVANNTFDGKVLIPFCTFGSGGLESSQRDLSAALPSATILDGFGIRNARLNAASKELDEFLIRLGVKEGDVETLPDYSPEIAVDKDTKALFDSACASYPMPLGNPISVGSRKTSKGMDYIFTVEAQEKNGFYNHNKIYITRLNGGVPEFTKVVR